MEYKAVTAERKVLKGYGIEQLLDEVLANPSKSYQFFIGYKELQQQDFLTQALAESKNFDKYYQAYKLLKNPKTFKEYVKKI